MTSRDSVRTWGASTDAVGHARDGGETWLGWKKKPHRDVSHDGSVGAARGARSISRHGRRTWARGPIDVSGTLHGACRRFPIRTLREVRIRAARVTTARPGRTSFALAPLARCSNASARQRRQASVERIRASAEASAREAGTFQWPCLALPGHARPSPPVRQCSRGGKNRPSAAALVLPTTLVRYEPSLHGHTFPHRR
jgi:hypothetical protein